MQLSKGTRVVTLPTMRSRRLAVDFPGWDSPSYVDFLLEPEAGLAGVVTSVESHGSNPWTRYSVRFDDGTSSSGLTLGSDIAVEN